MLLTSEFWGCLLYSSSSLIQVALFLLLTPPCSATSSTDEKRKENIKCFLMYGPLCTYFVFKEFQGRDSFYLHSQMRKPKLQRRVFSQVTLTLSGSAQTGSPFVPILMPPFFLILMFSSCLKKKKKDPSILSSLYY